MPFLVAGVAGLAGTGCATHKYVSREVGEVNQKVETLNAEVEKTQERVRRNEVRIDEVNNQAQTGVSEAKGAARDAMQRANEAQQTAERAEKGKLLYTVTLSNDKVTFPRNKYIISDDAKRVVDEAIGPFIQENRGVYFEIEGHTDSTGPEAYNLQLGEERATAVRNYLHDQHRVALNHINVISYGESQPVVDNKTRDHRAQNRRVVIKVLE
jgi:outer membrane protein OmpA-like peptidoglycan-associated protein